MKSVTQPSLPRQFRELELPPKGNADVFRVSTARLAGSAHRIGKDPGGNPVILLKIDDSSSNQAPEIRLENLSVLHQVPCRIWTSGASPSNDKFSLIRFESTSEALQNYFLGVMQPLLGMLGKKPTPQTIAEMLQHVVEVFRALSQPPRGSVQGLWSELFLLSLATDPLVAVGAWHKSVTETFDFTLGNARVEVKSCSTPERHHIFALEQLSVPRSGQALVASVLTQRASGGVSIAQLAVRVRKSIAARADLILRIDKAIAITLGDFSAIGLHETFSEDYALESLRFIDARDIPRPGEIPATIAKVRFEADLSELQSISFAALRKTNDLFRALIPS